MLWYNWDTVPEYIRGTEKNNKISEDSNRYMPSARQNRCLAYFL